ncbi:MAG: CHRD domain-containing protein [Actinomycetota bacterium]
MRTRVAALVLTVALAAGVPASPAGAQTTVLHTTLTTEQVPTGGDPTGSGFAVVVIDASAGRLCAVVYSRQAGPATAVHIHEGPVGDLGPHAVDLNDPVNGGGAAVSSGCYGAPGPVLADIAANPAGYYVNVHTAAYPAGAVRGQLG